MSLIILTLTWDASDKLSKLKESLMPALEGIDDYVWHIKDNSSKDDTVAKASTWGDKVKIYPYKDNLQNFAEGVNFLFKQANPKDSDLILLLNNDVIINDVSSIKNMISIINKDPTVGVVGARLLYTDTDKIQHCGVVFDDRYKLPTHYRSKQSSNEDDLKNRLFQAVTGAVLLTKAEYFKKICTSNPSGINGMSEEYRWAFDDVDLCLSIHYKMGKKIVYCGKTNIFHEESASLKKNPTNRLFLTHNINCLVSKWGKTYLIDRDIYSKNSKHNLYNSK